MTSYLLSGRVNADITKGIDFRFSRSLNLFTALKIRFLLHQEVREFLRILRSHLVRIRTEVSRERNLSKGEVRGHIDWKRTMQIWASTAFHDKTTLATSRPVKNYDIPENLILKKTVTIMKDFMDDKEVKAEIEREFAWSKELEENRHSVGEVLRNVHFRRIMDKSITVTPRMKTQVKKSRRKIYRKSCEIFEKYETVFLQQKIGELLERTFIDPENVEKIYELFCLFTVIKTLEEQMGWEVVKLKEITKERNETVVLRKGKSQICIFYNVTGNLQFFDRTEPFEIKNALNLITQAYFGSAKQDMTRRPDIIIELSTDGLVKDYILLEVKYTENEDYTVAGISQALHYLYDLKKEASIFFGANLGNGYNAAVIAYKLPKTAVKTDRLENQKLKVKIFDFDDLRNHADLKEFFEKCFLNRVL